MLQLSRDWFISVISCWNRTVSVPKEREEEGECNGVIGLHWICLFVDWFQVNTTKDRHETHHIPFLVYNLRFPSF